MSDTPVGGLDYWDVLPFLRAAEILAGADEPLRALHLLDNLPGYYRDHPPQSVLDLKRDMYEKLMTPYGYMHNKGDARSLDKETAARVMHATQRGVMLRDEVKKLNESGKFPHLVDLGPGEYWLPIALQYEGFNFSYQDIGLHQGAKEDAWARLNPMLKVSALDAPRILVACEIIEHLHYENDIRIDGERAGGNFDIIHISTPKYTFDPKAWDWRSKGDMGHLRTYTPNEFWKVVTLMWPEYKWEIYDGRIMHMRGTRDTKNKVVS